MKTIKKEAVKLELTDEQLKAQIEAIANYTPLDRQVLIIVQKVEEIDPKTGIVRSKSVIDEMLQAIDNKLPVLAVSPTTTTVSVGDRVVPKRQITPVQFLDCIIEGFGLAQISENDLYGVLK